MMRNTVIEMGYPQPATSVQTDNSFSKGFSNPQEKQRRSKAINMLFYWIQDRFKQGQFYIIGKKASKIWLLILPSNILQGIVDICDKITRSKFIKLILRTTPISKILSIKLTFNSHFKLIMGVSSSVPLGSIALNPSVIPAWAETSPVSLYTYM